MTLNEFNQNLQSYFDNGLQYSERAIRDMKKAHIDEAALKKLLLENVNEIIGDENGFILHIKRASKIYAKTEQGTLFINSIVYNPAFAF